MVIGAIECALATRLQQNMTPLQHFYVLIALESTIGLTFVTNQIGLPNLLPIWLSTPCAQTDAPCFAFSAEQAMGFGYWAFYAALVIEDGVVRRR